MIFQAESIRLPSLAPDRFGIIILLFPTDSLYNFIYKNNRQGHGILIRIQSTIIYYHRLVLYMKFSLFLYFLDNRLYGSLAIMHVML